MAPASPALTAPPFVRLAAHPVRWRLLSELAGSDYRVRELVSRVEEPQNLVSYHLRLLRDGGLVSVSRSSHDGRDSYYHLDLDRCAEAIGESGAALHPGLRTGPANPVIPLQRGTPSASVLFVCTGNSSRSPIAEALLRHRAGSRVATASAGTRPRSAIHPNAVRVLREEFGIDIAGQRPRHLDALATTHFDHVITLCDRAREACPEFPDHPRRAHWSIVDPAAGDLSDDDSYPAFQRTAAEIDARIRYLLPLLATLSPTQEVQP